MNKSFKKLALDMVRFEDSLKTFFETIIGDSTEIKREKNGLGEHISIRLRESATEYHFIIYLTSKGATLDFSNYGMSDETIKEILIPMKDWLIEKCSYNEKRTNFSIKKIDESTVDTIISFLKEENFVIEEETINENSKRIKIKSAIDGIELTLTHYSTKTLLIQGISGYCYWSLFKLLLNFGLIDSEDEKKIISSAFDKNINTKNSKVNKKIISCLEEDCRIMLESYEIISSNYSSIELPDYSFLCYYPLKVAEAVLRDTIKNKVGFPADDYYLEHKKLIIKNKNDKEDAIIVFSSNMKLNSILTTTTDIKDAIEDLYTHYHTNRHGLFHAEEAGLSRTIGTFIEANEISQKTIKLIENLIV